MCFLDNGCLPPGIHFMTWLEFYDNFSFSNRRKSLLEGLSRAITELKKCKCDTIYIDGSFVTKKLDPNDYDACWSGDINIVIENMKKIEPIFLDLHFPRDNQKKKYMGEVFPAMLFADSKGTSYLDFFQQIRYSSDQKGIVAIKL